MSRQARSRAGGPATARSDSSARRTIPKVGSAANGRRCGYEGAVSNEPLVSVVLPAAEAGGSPLAAPAPSRQRPREPRWECLLVDDGSRDAARTVAEAAARADSRIR